MKTSTVSIIGLSELNKIMIASIPGTSLQHNGSDFPSIMSISKFIQVENAFCYGFQQFPGSFRRENSERNSITLRVFCERWLLSFRSKAHVERALTFLWLIDLRIKWGASLQGFPFTSFYKFKMHFILMLKSCIYILPSSCSVPILHLLLPTPLSQSKSKLWWFELPQDLGVGLRGAY